MPRGTVLVRSKNKSFSFFKLVVSKGKAFGCYVDRLPKTPPFKGRRFHYQVQSLSKFYAQQKSDPQNTSRFFNLCWHRSIFPGSRPPSIFDTDELNFCVRNGNRWILIAISTDLNGDPWENRTPDYAVRGRRLSRLTNGPYGAPSGTRTRDPLIKSQLLYQLS